MNHYSINLADLVEKDENYLKGGFAEHFLIGYATSSDFKIDVVESSIIIDDNLTIGKTSVISFKSSYHIDKLRTYGAMIMRDTSQNKSIESFNKPYAVAKRVVVLSQFSESSTVDESKFNSDIGDFLHFALPVIDKDGQIYLHIIIGVLNSSLTESYTPLSDWTDTKMYFDFKDFGKLTPNPSDAIMQEMNLQAPSTLKPVTGQPIDDAVVMGSVSRRPNPLLNIVS